MLTRKTLATGVAATSIMFGFGAVAPAWATSNIQVLGVQETVKDINGPLTGYTVTGLMPSSDPVPYPVAGRLYEATVKTDAVVGTVTPAPSLFNARAENGDNYPSLAAVASLGGPVGQGGSSTGKVYFDVVGSTPNSVVYNNGFEDILGWIQPPGVAPEEVAPPAGGGGASSGGGGEGSTGPNQASPNTSGGEIGGGEGGTQGGGGNLDSGGGSGAPNGNTG
ncbi:MAG: hypothetical protein QOJ24_4544 [Mycobacterium sp.]|jgi:hypothetical protein|nr:hypothetical protein [Mycobacterium sp.]